MKMGQELRIMADLHTKTARDYIKRMSNDKVECMKIARKYGKDYWDGDRKYGYGGYNYIPGRWVPVAEKLMQKYNLTNNSKVLDIGCGKGYLLYEIKKILPGCKVTGLDISKYAVENGKMEIRKDLSVHRAQEPYDFKNGEFDLVISITTLHNLKIYDLHSALREIERVGKDKYIVVESHRDEKELFNLQCWALTAQAFFSVDEWKWLFGRFGYTGDYEFIFFE